jgi:hypothetical protein
MAEGELRALQEDNKSFIKRLFVSSSMSPSTRPQGRTSSSANHDSNIGPTTSDTTTTTIGAVTTRAIEHACCLIYQKQVSMHESVRPGIDQTERHDEDDGRRYRLKVTDLFQRFTIWSN